VGGGETLRSDFRLVAATNRNLEQEVKALKFREDLYYRLNVFPIYVPPLRERKEDIPLLADYFLRIYATNLGKAFKKIPEADMDKLILYDWPGNVRELENIIERGTILSTGPYFQVPELGINRPPLTKSKTPISLNENERLHILWVLQKTGWKIRGQGGAAELLEIHPSTLASRMKKLNIHRPKGIRKRRSPLRYDA
jgi:transcriptional regulator with GAF, ATPase, and Fis domain